MTNKEKQNVWFRIKDKSARYVRSAIDYPCIYQQRKTYRQSPETARQSYYTRIYDPETISKKLVQENIPVREEEIDLHDFQRWLLNYPETDRCYQGTSVHIEKCLEHHLAFKWLDVKRGDTYIDIAAAASIWADALRKNGVNAYRLDLAYPKGISGTYIGADAGDMKLPEGFANSMSLQCAFETFQGDADIRFIREAQRVLSHKGRFTIAPLYLDETFYILSSPHTSLKRIKMDEGSIRVWREDNYREPFSRHYSPKSFASRIFRSLDGMKGEILRFANLDEIRSAYPGQRIYCDFMFFCSKGYSAFGAAEEAEQ